MDREESGSWHGFGGTCQRSIEWLDVVAAELGDNRQHAYHALRGVLHALRDRLPVAEATDLAAQLPMLLRGLYYDGFSLRTAGQRYRTKREFLDHVRDGMKTGPNRVMDIPPDDACRAVFLAIERFVTDGEVRQVINALPAEIQEMWPVEVFA